jgi:opacity protein-like surface antigen
MSPHLATARRSGGVIAALLFAPCTTIAAQTNDEARLTIGISAGWIAAAQLWDVPRQIVKLNGDSDSFHLQRELRSDITISGHGTFFPGPHLGFTGEFTYLGLGTTDACSIVQDSNDPDLTAVCNAINGEQRPASVTTVQGGIVLRPFSRSFIQLYGKILGGLAFTPSSTISMTSIYGQIGDTLLSVKIYNDDHTREIRPTWTLGAGLATAPSSGYQLRIEVRETWLPETIVTAGDPRGQSFVPPYKTVIKGFPSVMVGFDVVMEKRRGRRY